MQIGSEVVTGPSILLHLKEPGCMVPEEGMQPMLLCYSCLVASLLADVYMLTQLFVDTISPNLMKGPYL